MKLVIYWNRDARIGRTETFKKVRDLNKATGILDKRNRNNIHAATLDGIVILASPAYQRAAGVIIEKK